MRFIDKLAVLGGAELALLRLVPTALGQFVQFALVLLGTALMAAVSMWFAMVQGLKVNPLLAVPFAALWGLLILNLDRYLTTSMQSTSSFKTGAMDDHPPSPYGCIDWRGRLDSASPEGV